MDIALTNAMSSRCHETPRQYLLVFEPHEVADSMSTASRYVGRTVRLREEAYEFLLRRYRRSRDSLENLFLVATLAANMKTLVCYGAGLCISVCPADVVLE